MKPDSPNGVLAAASTSPTNRQISVVLFRATLLSQPGPRGAGRERNRCLPIQDELADIAFPGGGEYGRGAAGVSDPSHTLQGDVEQGPVFADRYHAHLLESSREAFQRSATCSRTGPSTAEREGQPRPVVSTRSPRRPSMKDRRSLWKRNGGCSRGHRRPRTRSWAWLPRPGRLRRLNTAALGAIAALRHSLRRRRP